MGVETEGLLDYRGRAGVISIVWWNLRPVIFGVEMRVFGPHIFQWGGGLPRERVGAKKFDTSLEAREIKLFGRDIPGFCRDILAVPEKFEKKKFVFNFRSL